METSWFTFSQKGESYEYAISWEGYACRVLGFSGSTVSPFSEAWWKCEFCIVLWTSVEASECNSQKTSRPTGKRGVLLHHDSVRSRAAWATQERIQELQWELLEHPPYSPDLASSDFQLFGPLTNHFGDKSFADNEQVDTKVRKWLRQQSNHFYAAGFDALVKWWDKCINVGGRYFQKQMFFFSFENRILYMFYINSWRIY
jgi:histone-lysine N-methyltransferase SETMAR